VAYAARHERRVQPLQRITVAMPIWPRRHRRSLRGVSGDHGFLRWQKTMHTPILRHLSQRSPEDCPAQYRRGAAAPPRGTGRGWPCQYRLMRQRLHVHVGRGDRHSACGRQARCGGDRRSRERRPRPRRIILHGGRRVCGHSGLASDSAGACTCRLLPRGDVATSGRRTASAIRRFAGFDNQAGWRAIGDRRAPAFPRISCARFTKGLDPS